MSSFSENIPPSSSQFLAPQSAQPPRSLFGGPSSDAAPLPSSQPVPPRASIFGGFSSQDAPSDPMDEGGNESDEDDLDMILQERPLEVPDESDEESFKGSDEDTQKQKPKTRTRIHPSFPTRHNQPAPAKLPPQTWVLDRGLDLPPGVERPNRWTGPPKSYKNVIAGERGVYDSFMTTRSRDLAAHLYNVFALRNGMKKDVDTMDDEGVQESIYVPKRWVAWPLPSAAVPRVDEAIHRTLDSDTLRMPSDPRPSADLEESIMARMMKTAKERFEAREWDLDEVRTNRAYSPTDPEDTKDGHDDKKDEEMSSVGPLRPVVQADDSASRHQLQPLIRNVISQMDQVLTGLHHSMKGRYNGDTTSDESSATDTDDEASRSRSRRKHRSRSQSRGRKRVRRIPRTPENAGGRALSTRSSTGPETEDESGHGRSRSRGRSYTSHDAANSIYSRFALRDWSEVMGLAAMTGLPSATVMRASKRCADLFGQDMTFRTLGESRVKKASRADSRSWKYAYVESDTCSETETEAAPKKRRRRRPNSQCRPQPQSQRSRSRSAAVPVPAPYPSPALPLSSNEAASVPGLVPDDDPSATLQQREPPQRGKGKGAHRKADLLCPIENCPRHTNGFSRVWNLNLHLRRAHHLSKTEAERSPSHSVPDGDVIELE